ncbi:MAG: hypothetical protein Q6373_013565 [Candidatus Sigynarchaeota archaeon]
MIIAKHRSTIFCPRCGANAHDVPRRDRRVLHGLSWQFHDRKRNAGATGEWQAIINSCQNVRWCTDRAGQSQSFQGVWMTSCGTDRPGGWMEKW